MKEIKIIHKENSVELTLPYSFCHDKKELTLFITSEDGYDFIISDYGYTISALQNKIHNLDSYKEKIHEILSMHNDAWIENNCIKMTLPSLETNATNRSLFNFISVLSMVYHVDMFPILEKKAKVF